MNKCEALGKIRGPEDFRVAGQRFHDALQHGCAPQPRAGSHVQVPIARINPLREPGEK